MNRRQRVLIQSALYLIVAFHAVIGDFCGDNRLPIGIEVHRNGQLELMCSKPDCFDHKFAECDERAMRYSCDSETSWVGGVDKGYGDHQPLYVQCCEYDEDDTMKSARLIHNKVTMRVGEWFEGGEVHDNDRVVAVDIVSNIRQIHDMNATEYRAIAYEVTIHRIACYEEDDDDKNNKKKKNKKNKGHAQWP